eukprot:s5658_g2.t1
MATFLLPSAVTPAPRALALSSSAGAALHAARPAAAPALGLCLTLAVAGHLARRGRVGRGSRVGRRAQRPINARDGKTIPQGGSWLFPAVDDDELYEEMENELPPKKSLEDSVYCCWVTPKKKASELFASWAEDEAADDEQKDMLLNLSATEMKKGWTIWGLCHSEEDRGPGFYIVPPCEADALVVVEAVDEDKNNIQHL